MRILKNRLKEAFKTAFPQTATRFFSARPRAVSHKLVQKWGCTAVNRKLVEAFGAQVFHGPFKGMTLSDETFREHVGPHLLGRYEYELNPIWGEVFRMSFKQIIDVGAKFGFYAVGLARQFPAVPVIAFDSDSWARMATREMADANHVQLEVRSFCDPAWLGRNLQESAFIFSDCEGYESVLFEQAQSENLASATMLIEVHEQFSQGVMDRLRAKFSGTHEIVVIPQQPGALPNLPELDILTPNEREIAVSGYRGVEELWMYFKPQFRRTPWDVESLGDSGAKTKA